MLKKILAILTVLLMFATFCGCNSEKAQDKKAKDTKETVNGEELSFNDYDVLFASALQAGVMSPEEYEYEMSMAREDGWRKDFLELIEQPNLEVFEAIEGNHAEKGYSIAELVREKDYWSIFKCQGTMIVEGYWAGYELEYEPPMDIKTRIKRDITNKRKRILKPSKGSSTN